MGIDERRLAETIEYVAVRRLQDRYADIVNRRTWDELHEVMRPDCTLTLDLGDRDDLGSLLDRLELGLGFDHSLRVLDGLLGLDDRLGDLLGGGVGGDVDDDLTGDGEGIGRGGREVLVGHGGLSPQVASGEAGAGVIRR